jgi:S-adenosylmethionine decarboxylase
MAKKLKSVPLKRSYRIGREIIADLKGCDVRVINDEQLLKRLVQEAVRKTNHHLLNIASKKFTPVGVTILGVLAESHISLHTYPEIGYVGIDIFTCGPNRPEPIFEYLKGKLSAKEVYWEFIKRGTMRQWKNIFKDDGYKREIEITKMIEKRVTPYQTLEVVKTKKFGTCLFSNGVFQYSTIDPRVYDCKMSEKISKNVKKVLIVGGGDCSILSELAKNKNIKEIYLLEQDQQVIEIAKKYFGKKNVIKDPRLKMFFGNAIDTIPYLKDKKIGYAVIDIVSSSEEKLKRFYNQLFQSLYNIKVPAFPTSTGQVCEIKKFNSISKSAQKLYKKVYFEDKWFLSGGMTRFLYGEGT